MQGTPIIEQPSLSNRKIYIYTVYIPVYLYTSIEKTLCVYVLSFLSSSVGHSLSLFLFRIQRRTRSGGYISETCPVPSPLCWCCSPQPTTQTVHSQSHDMTNEPHVCYCHCDGAVISTSLLSRHSDDPCLLPQQSLLHFLCRLQRHR